MWKRFKSLWYNIHLCRLLCHSRYAKFVGMLYRNSLLVLPWELHAKVCRPACSSCCWLWQSICSAASSGRDIANNPDCVFPSRFTVSFELCIFKTYLSLDFQLGTTHHVVLVILNRTKIYCFLRREAYKGTHSYCTSGYRSRRDV